MAKNKLRIKATFNPKRRCESFRLSQLGHDETIFGERYDGFKPVSVVGRSRRPIDPSGARGVR